MLLSWANFIYPPGLTDVINAWLILWTSWFPLSLSSILLFLWQKCWCPLTNFQPFSALPQKVLYFSLFTQRQHCTLRSSTLILKLCRLRGMQANTLGQTWLSSTSKCPEEGNTMPWALRHWQLGGPDREAVKTQNVQVWRCILFRPGPSPQLQPQIPKPPNQVMTESRSKPPRFLPGHPECIFSSRTICNVSTDALNQSPVPSKHVMQPWQRLTFWDFSRHLTSSRLPKMCLPMMTFFLVLHTQRHEYKCGRKGFPH